MKKVQQRPFGFTLIELIVVIAVIGILAGLSVFGFSRFQEDTRDAQRSSNVSVIIEALEKYFDANGEYPSCTAITAAGGTVTTTTLPGVDQTALLAPNAPTSATNSIKCEPVTVTGEDFFEYQGDGSPECATGASCLQYTLKYKEEGSDSIIEIASRRSTPISATGTISSLDATATGFSTIGLTWGSVPNASGYRLQRATNSGFTTGLVTTDLTTNEATATGLTAGTTYYFRVTQLISGTPGNWSNTDSALTWKVGTPTLQTANVASATSVTLTWTNVSYESSYTLQYSTSSTFASGNVSITGIAANTTSRTVTGLTSGTLYYFRVQGVATGDTGAWSNSLSAAPIGQATISSTSASACAAVTVDWSALAGASTYTLKHSAASDMSSATTITGLTGTTTTVTGLPQGFTRYFTLAGVTTSGYTGVASTVASRLVTICNPTNNSVTRDTSVTTGLKATSNAVCAAGTDEFYQWYANGSAWVSGTGSTRQTVTYSLNYGQSVTLTVSVRCQTANTQTSLIAASNSVSYTRPGMNLSITFGDDACSGSFCGRRVNADWTNVCSTTSSSIAATQLSYSTTMSGGATSHTVRWKGASSPGVDTSYNVNIGCTSSSATFKVISIYKCTGCS